jgi:outer membrane protein TolC
MNAQEELANAQKNIALAEKIYKVSQLKYKEGIGSSIELTTAEQQLYTTQANLLNAIYKVVVAKADINKALGTN